MAGKFLVLWKLELSHLGMDMMHALLKQQDYAERLQQQGKLERRYHLVGGHGGACVYAGDSNEELDRLLAMSPVYNLATYNVYPLAEMEADPTVVQPDWSS